MLDHHVRPRERLHQLPHVEGVAGLQYCTATAFCLHCGEGEFSGPEKCQGKVYGGCLGSLLGRDVEGSSCSGFPLVGASSPGSQIIKSATDNSTECWSCIKRASRYGPRPLIRKSPKGYRTRRLSKIKPSRKHNIGKPSDTEWLSVGIRKDDGRIDSPNLCLFFESSRQYFVFNLTTSASFRSASRMTLRK